MNKFPKIETDRLILDKLKLEDSSLIAKYAGDKKVSEFTLNIPHPYTEADAIWWVNNSFKSFEEKKNFHFSIYLKSTKEFIGGISLPIDYSTKVASLGYWIAVPFWNKGYMTEAVKAVIQFGFETQALERIFAQHLVENKASGKVMQKAGMKLEALLEKHNEKNGVFRDVKEYAIMKNEFENQ